VSDEWFRANPCGKYSSDAGTVPDPCYSSEPGHDNSLVTATWRDPIINEPEQCVVGQMYEDYMDFFSPYYNFANLIVMNTNLWPFNGTSLDEGDNIPGIISNEYDKVWTEYPTVPGLIRLAESPLYRETGQDKSLASHSNVTMYTHSGYLLHVMKLPKYLKH
jgi:hypothetical protein